MTTINVTADALRAALAGMATVIPSSPTLPILGHLKLHTEGDDLVCTGTDLDTTAVHRMPCVRDGEFKPVCVNLKQLKKLVNCKNGKEQGFTFVQFEDTLPLKEGETEARVVQRNKLSYTLGGQVLEVSLSWLPAEDFPPTPEIKGELLELDEREVKALIEVAPFMSTDETRYVLNGVCLDGSRGDDNNAIVATDGRRLGTVEGVYLLQGCSIIIPKAAKIVWWLAQRIEPDDTWSLHYVKQWHDYSEAELREMKEADENARITIDAMPKTMTIEAKGWTVHAKEVEGNYPNYRQVIPAEHKTRITFSETALDFVVNSFPALPENGNERKESTVTVKVEGGTVKLQVKRVLDTGGDEITGFTIPDVKVEGDDVTVLFNRHYMQEAIACRHHEWRLNDELNPILMADKDRQHVLMPMRG